MLKKVQQDMKPTKPIMCEHIMTPWGQSGAVPAFLSTDHTCEYCGGTDHYTPAYDPVVSKKFTWLCENTDCVVYSRMTRQRATTTPPKPERAILWTLFCEINDIGDIHHDVRFEKIEQPKPKIDYLLKFGTKPSGIIVMQGSKGTGKTYASMGVCELYTRENYDAIFGTQKQILRKWLETFRDDMHGDYIDKLMKCRLLVVDDFGTSEVTPAFMSFFLDLINTRMQWTDRGTIITTNLSDKACGLYCGEALSDRFRTGMLFEFKENSRRKQVIL